MLRGKPTGTGFALTIVRLTLYLCALICALPAVAGTTWDGGGANSLWSTANNWNPNGVPANNGTASLAFAGTTRLTPDMDANWSINSLTFNSGAGAFTLGSTGGFVLTIQGGGITNNSASTETINNAITLGTAQTWSATSGGLTFGGNITNGGFLLTISGGSNTSASGVISGTGGLTKSGAGTLTLSGTNTYSGGTTFNAGTVSISSNSNLGAAAGGLTFNGGTLQVTGNVIGTRAITMTGAGTFDVALGKTIEESGVVSGNGNLSVINYGTLILSGSGSNGTGSTNIAGILSLRGTVALGSGNLAFTTGILELGSGNFTRSLGAGAGQVNMSGGGAGYSAFGADRIVNLGGSGATVTWGAGNFVAAGQVLYFGTTTADHTLDFQNGINLNGASRSIQVVRGVGSVPEGKISGVISGAGTSNFSLDAVPGFSAGSLTLSNGGNSYAGTTTINAGNLLLEANATGTAGNTVLGSGASDILLGNTSGAYDAGLLTNSAVTISRNIRAQSGNTGVITLGGNSASSSTFSGSIFLGTNSGTGKGVTLTAAAGGTTTFSGVIQDPTSVSGPGLLRKSGAGTVVLSGVNTYAGGTSIDGGTLSISQSTNLGANAGGVTINAGTLEITSGFSTNRVFTLADAASTFQIDPAQTFTITSVIGGGGALNKTGTGTLTLSGANTYSGGSVINAGTVIISSNGNLGAAAATATINAATLDIAATFASNRNFTLGTATSTVLVDPTFTFTANGIFSGGGTLNKTGAGTMVLGGVNSYTGPTTVSAGTLQISASERILNTSDLNVSGGTFDLQTFSETVGIVTLSSGTISGTGAGTLTGSSYTLQSGTVTAILAGSGTVTKNTAGTVTLSGSNTFTGSTTVSAGTLQVNTNNALGAAASGTTVASGAALKLNNVNYSTAEALTLNGSGISNGGALTNTGASTFAGPINVATNATINAGGGTLNLTGGISENATTLTIAGGGTVNITTNGITGSSANSNLVLDGTTVVLSAASSYNGATTIQNSGTLKLGGNNFLPTAPQTALTINTSSTFDLASRSDGVASLAGDSTATVKNSVIGGTSTLTVNPASGSTTFAGVIAGTNGGAQGNIALQKTGAGTLVLTGVNTYSGSTTINGGTLTAAAAPGSSALGSTSSIVVNSGGTLMLGGNDQINNTAPMTLNGGTFAKSGFSEGGINAAGVGALTLTAGSQLDFGTGAVGVLTFASFTPGAYALTIANWTGTANMAGTGSTDRLIFNSDQSGNLNSFLFTGYAGAVEFNLGNGYYEITPVTAVPETSTWLAGALSLGALGLHLALRRRAATRRSAGSPESDRA
jgi:autotransporter-associated beta strand protein